MTEEERLYFVELKRQSIKRIFESLEKAANEGTLKQVSEPLSKEEIDCLLETKEDRIKLASIVYKDAKKNGTIRRISIGKTDFKES